MQQKIILICSFLLCSFWVKAGTVDTVALQSTQLKKLTKVVVIKPSIKTNHSETYPVVYLLHGYSGNYATWITIAPQLSKTADDLKMIFVCPDGGFGSWYFDSPIDSMIKYESYITKELVPYIDAHYATKAAPAYRAITGLSMGGHGALYLAIRHLDLFGAAGSTSGGVDFTPFPNNWDIKKSLGSFEENKERWMQQTVLYQAASLQNNQLQIIVDCGVNDFFLGVNRSLHEKLVQLKINHDYIERPGSHNNAYWNNSIDYQILFFKKYFKQF